MAKKGTKYECGTCGTVMVVENPCTCTPCDVVCCGVPMKEAKPKKAAPKAKKKA